MNIKDYDILCKLINYYGIDKLLMFMALALADSNKEDKK